LTSDRKIQEDSLRHFRFKSVDQLISLPHFFVTPMRFAIPVHVSNLKC